MKIGRAQVDFEALLIESQAGRFPMESKVMAVLGILTENANKVMTREELIEAVWNVEFGGDERLTRAISLLRKAFGDTRGQHTHIETIPRRGYRLIAAIEDEAKTITPITAQTRTAPPSESIVEAAPLATALVTVPAKKRTGPRAIALIGIIVLTVTALWISPVGDSIANIPQNNRVETGLGYVKNFTKRDAIPEAQVLFASILADNPDHAAARAGLALALMREYTHLETDPALLHRAKSAAEAALRIDPHLALANTAVGWAAGYEGDYEKAHKAYDRADILDPNNIFTLEGRARTYNIQGKHNEARKTVELGISLYPNYAVFYSYSAQLLMTKNAYGHAEAMYRHAITLSPDNPRAYAQLAHSLHYQDRTTEAVRVLQDGLKVNETSLLYNNLGTYLFFQGQYEMSAQAFEQTLKFEGNTHDYLYWANLADAYRWVPTRKAEADTAYDRALELLELELDKNSAYPTYNSRAALYSAKRGHLDQARKALERVPFNSIESASEFYRAVVTYEILSDRAQALVMLERALKAGYPLSEILNDPELVNLRQDANYHRLLTTLNVKKESQL